MKVDNFYLTNESLKERVLSWCDADGVEIEEYTTAEIEEYLYAHHEAVRKLATKHSYVLENSNWSLEADEIDAALLNNFGSVDAAADELAAYVDSLANEILNDRNEAAVRY